MSTPQFSIVIPVYNQAEFLPDAIRSVLDQTFTDFEIIIVNDASPDNTADVVAQFTDPRIKYLVHEKNKGLPGARNTGMRAAVGDFIALLDSDDYYHPDKLDKHSVYLSENPTIDITYNARFELHHSSNEIRTIYQPPETVTIKDLLLGFPFSPSDMVLRRGCLEDVGLFDEGYVCGGEDLDYPCRLALARKKFARVNKVLNFRRFHSGRKKKNLTGRQNDYKNALENAFSDPRFPVEYTGLRQKAFASHYLEVATWALSQEEYSLGNQILREIKALNPDIFTGQPASLVRQLMKHSIRNRNTDHEKQLIQVFKNMDNEFQYLSAQLDWAISTGFLLRGTQDIIWNRYETGLKLLDIAKQRKASVNRQFMDELIAQLLSINFELGHQKALQAMKALAEPVRSLSGNSRVRYLFGNFAFNKACTLYHAGKYTGVPKELITAAYHSPAYLVNRGYYAVMFKSIINTLFRSPFQR